jgi:hypothetical protein
MPTILATPLLHWTVALSLALLWTSAAWHKLREPAGFARALAAYDLLPGSLCRVMARLLPWIETAVAAALLAPSTRNLAALASALLLLIYAGVMAINLARGRNDIDCGCGADGQAISWWLVIRNIALVTASLALLWPTEPGPMRLADATLTLFATILVCTAYVTASSIFRERAASDRDED